MTARTAIPDFSLANPLYAGGTVTAWTVDANGVKTATKVTLYDAPTGTGTLANPQTLDSEGKWQQPVYVEEAVVLSVSGLDTVDDHDTGVVALNIAGTAATDAQAAADAAAAYLQMAEEAARRAVRKAAEASVSAASLGLPDPPSANTFLYRNAGNTAYDKKTVAQTLTLLGLSAFVQTLIDDTTAGAFMTTLGLPGRNAWINGGLDVWQRGTGSTSCPAGSYTFLADRIAVNPTGAAITQQRSTSVPSGGRSRYSLLLTGAASVTTVLVSQAIEAAVIPGIKRTVTFSAYVYNGSGAAFTPTLLLGTPTASDDFTTVTNRLTQALQSCADAGWTRVTHTVDISGYTNIDNGLLAEIQIPSGSLVSGDTVNLTEFQIEAADAATPFERRLHAVEELLCLRYYWRTKVGATTPVASGFCSGATTADFHLPLPIEMVRTPDVAFGSQTGFDIYSGTAAPTTTAMGSTTSRNTAKNVWIDATVSTGLGDKNGAILTARSGSTNYIECDAELIS